jgi:hypothetical protein
MQPADAFLNQLAVMLRMLITGAMVPPAAPPAKRPARKTSDRTSEKTGDRR